MSDVSPDQLEAGPEAEHEGFGALLDEMVSVRGVEAAAVVTVDGEFLQGRAADETLLERMVDTVTSALAAGEALAGLMPAAAEETSSQQHLMVMYQDGGPILFTRLPGGEAVAVVALSSSHDIGRVRFQLRGLLARS